MTHYIIDTDEVEKVLNKYEGTSGWSSALCDDLRALIANSPQADDVRKDAERMVMLFAPDKKCDMGCMYACTEGFTKRADCIDNNKHIRELTEALKDLADNISANDDEGLCEHAEPMIKARALIDKARE